MRELVVVVSDLYLSQESPEGELPAGVALPGLQHLARFGTRSKVAGGWRPWLAHWLTAERRGVTAADLDAAPKLIATATVAAIARPPRARSTASPGATASPLATTTPPGLAASPAAMVWMATPVHLIAGLSTVHVDRRSVLRLSADELSALAAEFQSVFHDSGFALEPLDSGDFLLVGPQLAAVDELEPARFMGESVAEARQGKSASDPTLRRLGTEIEMWLHEHPINEARRRRGEAPVTGLWLWGGGNAPTQQEIAPRPTDTSVAADIAFGCDAYLQGLWASIGEKVFPLPQELAELFSYPEARRAAVVIDIGSMLHSAPTWTLLDALTHIDRVFIDPAVQALRASKLDRLVFLANDRERSLRARDRFKLWRRSPVGLSGLQ